MVITSSLAAMHSNPNIAHYAAAKAAIQVGLLLSLKNEAARLGPGVRVNAVAPGPIWTPLIPSTFPPDKVEEFGTDTPLGRVGQPDEVAACFLFLASDDSSYMTGQVLHPNGGTVVNG